MMALINKTKIITMAKLSVYEKRYGQSDRKILEYFRHDYVYKKNTWTRFYVILGSIFLIAMYWMKAVFVDGTDIFLTNIEKTVSQTILFIAAVSVFYTLIGTVAAIREYSIAEKRVKKSNQMLNHLNRMKEKDQAAEEASDVYNGTNAVAKRNFDKLL